MALGISVVYLPSVIFLYIRLTKVTNLEQKREKLGKNFFLKIDISACAK